MEMNVKKIIAREGLIILGLICLGALTEIASVFYLNHTHHATKREYLNRNIPIPPEGFVLDDPKQDYKGAFDDLIPKKTHVTFLYDAWQITRSGVVFFILGYPFYWVIRFILWAIKTLRKQ